jgi:hypothetical protein
MTHPAEGSETGDAVREPDPRDLMRQRHLDHAKAVILGAPCHDYPTPPPEESRVRD